MVHLHELNSQETKRHPQVFFGQLREGRGPYFVEGLNAWVTTSYEDALFVLRDPRLTKDRRKLEAARDKVLAEQALEYPHLLLVDPPDHSRLRRLVSKAFTPKMIEQLRPRIQKITEGLLDAVEGRGHMDLIAEFAYPLPITVISELLGIPEEDRSQFRHWTQIFINIEEEPERQQKVIGEFFAYIRYLCEEKRVHIGQDLISELVHVEENGDQLSENELIGMIFLLIVAGHETTVNLIGNGTLALLEHPDQLQLLRNDPLLLPGAVEELLRYTSPVSLSDERFALEDIELHGKTIHRGDQVLAALISANSDPRQFEDALRLDITRKENAHLAFGKGMHFCLGAPLARLEGQTAFGALLRRLPGLRLAVDPEALRWNNNPMLRGLAELPVRF